MHSAFDQRVILLVLLPSPFGRGAGDEGLREESIFLYLCSVVGEWHSKTKHQSGVDPAVSPHPNPLPMGEGDTRSLPLPVLTPSHYRLRLIQKSHPVETLAPGHSYDKIDEGNCLSRIRLARRAQV